MLWLTFENGSERTKLLRARLSMISVSAEDVSRLLKRSRCFDSRQRALFAAWSLPIMITASDIRLVTGHRRNAGGLGGACAWQDAP